MRRICCFFFAVWLLAGCGERGNNAAAEEAAGDSLRELPLKRGFYVSSDTPCGEASNATLLLMHGDRINGARDYCAFNAIVKMDPGRYRVTEECGEFAAPPEERSIGIAEWEIPNDTSFTSKNESGWERNFRYCDQSSLPEDWQTADISDVIGD
jgi:hypothetical protein